MDYIAKNNKSMNNLKKIESELSPLRKNLTDHKLYTKLKNLQDVQVFMEYHVYAVWDFMSLLKSLQKSLTCTQVPWVPNKHPELSRLINEIVLGEESDVNELGIAKSHYDMYLDAMTQVGASTSKIEQFVTFLINGKSIEDASNVSDLDKTILEFINFSFKCIETNKAHIVASVFTFGREDIIPDMFIEIVNKSEKEDNASYNKLTYYLNRHIELDADEHGPMALRMVSELCGEDNVKWEESLNYAKEALELRIKLWDRIHDRIAFGI